MKHFRELDFGYATAETERTERPELLSERYFDEQSFVNYALEGPTFLFLGYKGSGKSALLNHIDLAMSSTYNRFSGIYYLEDFSFANFSKIIRGDIEPEAKFPDAWAWLLLILAADSLSKDESVRHPNAYAYIETLKSLRSMGFLPNSNLRDIVKLSSKKTFKLTIPYVFEENSQYSPIEKVNDIPMFVMNMRNMLSCIRTDSYHYILIDGLDDILTSRKIQYKSLGALIFEIDRLNDFFKKSGVNLKFIIVCRTDLYENISGANKNKIRQDKARSIDWYHNPRNPEQSLLIEMASRKAGLVDADVISEYFPRRINDMQMEKFLLEQTRHTPRDFLMLLKKIAEVQKGDERITQNLVFAGVRLYSNDYFIGEIEDELDGYAKHASPKEWIELIGSFGKRKISIKEIEQKVVKAGLPVDEMNEVLNALFECSAIGNVISTGKADHFTFKFRNRNSRFTMTNDISIHQGLRKALNIP